MINRETWLNNLKVGDQVAWNRGYGTIDLVVALIVKSTKTEVEAGGIRFSRLEGRSINTGVLSYGLQPVTPGVKAFVIKQRIVARLNRVSDEEAAT